MKIIFNGTIFYKQKYGGISRYFYNLTKELIKKKTDFKIVTPFYKNLYLKDLNKNYKTGIYISRFPDLKIIDELQNKFNNYCISGFKPKIIHETYYSNKIEEKNSIKILTVYDLIHEKFPDYYSNNNKKLFLNSFDYFICISETTKRDLMDIYDIPDEKIKVIYLGGDHILFNQNEIDIHTTNSPYILYVGSRDKYKSFETLIEAYSNSNILQKDFKIICFGGGSFSKKEKDLFKKYKISKNIISIQGDDNILFNLYKKSKCLVSTSLYEGFGLPIVEAMYSKCPVVLSDCNTHKEIAKENVIYFKKQNSESLRDVLEKDLYNDEKLEKLKEIAHLYVKFFNWENCAEETLNVYKSLSK